MNAFRPSQINSTEMTFVSQKSYFDIMFGKKKNQATRINGTKVEITCSPKDNHTLLCDQLSQETYPFQHIISVGHGLMEDIFYQFKSIL